MSANSKPLAPVPSLLMNDVFVAVGAVVPAGGLLGGIQL